MYQINKQLTKTGLESLEVNGLQLHSKYDPLKEAEVFVEKEFKENYLHILFGYGLGYIAKKFQEKLPLEDLITVEPIEELIDDKNKLEGLVCSKDIDEIKYRILLGLKNKKREIKVICSPNYDKLAMDEYKKILYLTKNSQRFNILGINTIKFFSYDWQENYIKNMILVARDSPLSVLEKKYNCPVIIASSGPSLDKQLQKLKAIKGKVLILCAGSTINSLLTAGIDPNYIVTVDGSEANYNHFKNIKTKATLLYSLTSKFDIQKEYKFNRMSFLINSDGNYEDFLSNNLGKDLPIILGGSSVAHYALSIAKYISTGPVAFIGQDLAYTNNVSHSKANKNLSNINQFNKSDLIDIEGYYGGKVKSNYVFFAMKEDFENLLKLIGEDLKVYNCTEGGAKVDGMDHISFDEFIDRFVNGKDKVDTIIHPIEESENILNKLRNIYYDFINKLLTLKNEVNHALFIVKNAKQKGYFENIDIKKLNKIDRSINIICEKVLLSHITQALTNDILLNYKESKSETQDMKFQRILNQNSQLYEGMLDIITFTIKYLKDAIQIIEKDMKA